MKNLALQSETRHAFSLPEEEATDISSSGKIVAVIRQDVSDGFHHGSFDDEIHDVSQQSAPAVFLLTSDGYLTALDGKDCFLWRVDLEKVVLDSQDDDDEEETMNNTHQSLTTRSEWFYASKFSQENDTNTNTADPIIQLNHTPSMYLTCLSHGGHVVSVSIDETCSLFRAGEEVEMGSECIGSFENGLECGSWSPDGEVLALVTYAQEEETDDIASTPVDVKEKEFPTPILMTMNTHYEILSEVKLDPCYPSNAISMCWRPDSSSIAISTTDALPNTAAEDYKPQRRIRTFDRTTLHLLSLSKEEDGSGKDVPNLLSIPPTWASGGCSHYIGVVQSSRSITNKANASRRPIGMQVAFLEPNGLRHRECKIQMTYDRTKEQEEIVAVEFNGEGDLLCVISLVTSLNEEENTGVTSYGKLQLYHRSNYHWYLKYEIRYDNDGPLSGAVISKAEFAMGDPYRIVVALDMRHVHRKEQSHALEWREYTFRWDSSTIYYRDGDLAKGSSVLAMSIDGKTLNLTPLDKAVVPPPMYASSLELPAPVISVATRPSFASETRGDWMEFLVAMSDGRMALLKYGGSKAGVSLTPGFSPPIIMATVNVSKCLACDKVDSSLATDANLRDITIIDANEDSFTVVAVFSPNAGLAKCDRLDRLIEMKILWSITDSSCSADIALTAILPVREGRVLRLVNWLDTVHTEGARGSALIELTDGTLMKYSHGGVLELIDGCHLLEPCPWIEGMYDSHADVTMSSYRAEKDPAHGESSTPLIVGLSSRYRLYCGERIISSATSSFGVSIEHRFLTHISLGSRPQMRFIPIAALTEFDPLMGSDENAALDGYEPRSVERGSRLVALFPHSPSVVIQMPRGNLESISPRALALPYVMVKIRDRDYLMALDHMRRQRIDTNLIVDYDPEAFLEKGGAETFIGQIKKIDNINLFLSSLIDIDTTLWKYPVPSWVKTTNEVNRPLPQSIEVEAKVNKVCVKMREVMLMAEKDGATQSGDMISEGHFLLPVLSTFAKEVPARLEEALTLIKINASKEPQRQRKKTSILLSDHVQSSIQYLAFLADYELLFNTSIGMYDFELAKAVARHSQMDPKVYLPMLKRWRDELPECVARFEVDVKLKRYESALRHLVSSGENKGSCLEFIEEHKLHSLGLELFSHDSSFTCTIMTSLGESLLSERKFDEALTVFLSSEPKNFNGAKRAAKACGDWRAYFSSCGELGEFIDTDQITSIAESISSKMGTPSQLKDQFASAARILLDYGQDVAYAMDMFISGHMWFEGRRISRLHNRPDLAKKCIDAAASYANTCIEDLAERASTFESTNAKYAEVIVLRRDAIKEADETGIPDQQDDSASLFSMQSTASNSSLRSTASSGSMGSVGSISTVISVGSKTGFQFTGDRDTTFKHKSKFNKIGRDQKKKKKKKAGPAARRMKPGSEEHLKELVTTLTNTCPDEHYLANISETINFLMQSGKRRLARCFFDAYHELEDTVRRSQAARLESDGVARQNKEKMAREEGLIYEDIQHPCEKEVDEVQCKLLPHSLENVMSYLTI